MIKEPLFDKNGLPDYCGESLIWHEDSWSLSLEEGTSQFEAMTEKVYMMLYQSITEGVELEITPQQVRQQMMVMEECRRQNPQIYG